MKEQDAAHSFENECEFFLDGESIVFGCECGKIEIGGMTYYPESELTRLRSELQQEREKVERRCECELFVEKYFGLSPQTKETYLIKTDYGQLVNLLAMFRDKIKNNQLKFFKKGNSI